MFERLRPGTVIGGDDQQYPVDRQHAGQHVRQKPLVTGDIDKPQLGAVRQFRIGKAEIDRHPAPLFLGQAVGIDAGQRAHQRRLAVIDMAGGREDHRPLLPCPVSCSAAAPISSARNQLCAGSLAVRRCHAIDTVAAKSIGSGVIAMLGGRGDLAGDALRHRRDQIGGRQRRRHRQIGRDQQRDAPAQPEIHQHAVDRAGRIAARRHQQVVERGIGLDRERRAGSG